MSYISLIYLVILYPFDFIGVFVANKASDHARQEPSLVSGIKNRPSDGAV